MRRLSPWLGGLALALCCPLGAAAVDLAMPQGARMTVERNTEFDSYDVPLAGFDGQVVPVVTVEGTINRRAWRIATAGLTPLQVMAPLRAQLEAQGYEVVFDCASKSCGGFDFRFAVEVLPGPNMYVNIASYRYLTALRGPADAPVEAVSILVSATAASAYVQVIEALSGQVPAVPRVALPETAAQVPALPQGETKLASLLDRGFVILGDLEFATGTSQLSQRRYASLQALADVLQARSDLRVALVGHTDAVGGLSANLAVSRARAQAVRTRLIEDYGIAAARLEADGIGYLAPIASNLTEEGRQRNRRVEAVLLNTE